MIPTPRLMLADGALAIALIPGLRHMVQGYQTSIPLSNNSGWSWATNLPQQ